MSQSLMNSVNYTLISQESNRNLESVDFLLLTQLDTDSKSGSQESKSPRITYQTTNNNIFDLTN